LGGGGPKQENVLAPVLFFGLRRHTLHGTSEPGSGFNSVNLSHPDIRIILSRNLQFRISSDSIIKSELIRWRVILAFSSHLQIKVTGTEY